MPPNTATKLGQMGDVNANKEKLRKAIDFAKKNPEHPDAVELRKRLERGMFNVELKALGKQPFPVQQPKIDLKAAMAGVQQEPGLQTKVPEPEKPGLLDTAKETLGDVKETAIGVGKQFAKGAVNAFDTVTDPELNPAQKFAAASGNIAAGASGIIGELTIGAGKAAISQDAENKIKEVVSSIGESVADTEIVRKATDWYEGLDKNDKAIVDSLGGIMSLVTEMVGLKGASVVGKGLKEGAEATIDATAPVIGKGVETAVDLTKRGVDTGAGLVQRAVTPSPAEVTKRIDDAVGRILQGTPDDIKAGRNALRQIDTTGVEDYAGLNTRITETTQNLARKVDTELDKYPDVIKAEEWVKTTKVGDEVVTQNPLKDALDGLENAYTLSGELPEAARIRQLRTKLEADGLTRKEANNIAREYGMEFRDRAFTKLGDPKPGYGAENFENVRVGVKRAVREKMPDTVTKELDAQMSDLYATKILTEKMETNVQKLYQKVKNRTLMQKAGAAAADLVDLASLGTLRGFVQKILPSNVGLKTANSLDLQEELVKNLRTIEKLNKIEDPRAFALAFENYLKEPAIGMSIKSTVTPLKVGKEMSEPEFDLMVDGIEDISLARSNPDFNNMLKKHGLSNAKDEELVRFMKEATDQFETPETSFNQGAIPSTTLFHGTAKGNIFSKFEVNNGRVGNGQNMFHQGNVIYLTDSKEAANFFSTQATRNAKLRDKSLSIEEATGGTDQVGEVMTVQLDKGAKVKSLNYRPNKAEVDDLRRQGFDAVSFPEEAFNASDLAGISVSGLRSNTIAVLNPNKVKITPTPNSGATPETIKIDTETLTNKGATVYHGTRLKAIPDSEFLSVTPNKQQASDFGNVRTLGKDKGQNVTVHEIQLSPGKTKKIEFTPGKIDAQLYKAKEEGYEYVVYDEPSISGKDQLIQTIVVLNPKKANQIKD